MTTKKRRKILLISRRSPIHINSSYDNNKKKESKYGNNNGILVDSTDPSSKQLTANKNDAVDAGILHHHSSGKPQVSSALRHQRLLGTKAGGKPAKNMHKKIRELEMKLQAKDDELDNVKAELAMCQGENKDNGNDNGGGGFGAGSVITSTYGSPNGNDGDGGGFGATDEGGIGSTCKTTSDCKDSATVCCKINQVMEMKANFNICKIPGGIPTVGDQYCCSGKSLQAASGYTVCMAGDIGSTCKTQSDCADSNTVCCGGACLVPDGLPVGTPTLNGAAASCCSGDFVISNAGRTYRIVDVFPMVQEIQMGQAAVAHLYQVMGYIIVETASLMVFLLMIVKTLGCTDRTVIVYLAALATMAPATVRS